MWTGWLAGWFLQKIKPTSVSQSVSQSVGPSVAKSNILKCKGVPDPPYFGNPGSVGSDGVEEGPQMML